MLCTKNSKTRPIVIERSTSLLGFFKSFATGIIASGLGATEGVSFLLLSGSCFWLLTYCLVHVTVLILRKRNPEYPRKKWLTLGGIPQIIGILGNVYMIWNISTGETRIKIFELCGVMLLL